MAGTVLIPTYEYLGTIASEPTLTVRVARRLDSDRLLVVNRIAHSQNMHALFRDLYASYARRQERSDFLELFSMGRDFYAAFQYYQGPNLAELYDGCSGGTAKRLEILIAALLQIHNAAWELPSAVICSVLQPENILLDDNERIHLLYRFEPAFLAENAGCSPWLETANLLGFMLEKELKDPFFRMIHDIHRMCVAGLYPSLPAMVSDLEKALRSLGQTGFFHAAREFIIRQRLRIAQVSWLGIVTLFTFLIIYLINGLTSSRPLESATLSDIGIVTYVAAQNEDDNSLQLTDPSIPQGGNDLTFSGLPDMDTPLESEDYIVQPGDTLETVCSLYYGSGSYAELVAGFNGLNPLVKPDAGSVLRLPLRDQLAQYLEN